MDDRFCFNFWKFLFLYVVFFFLIEGNIVKFFGIGVMLFFLGYEKIFEEVVGKINDNLSGLLRIVKLNGSFYVLSLNFICLVFDVCENLVVNGVVIVIVSYLKDDFLLLILILYVCGFY